MKKRILLLAAFLGVASVVSSFAQTNLGADCGCKPIGQRPIRDVKFFADSLDETPPAGIKGFAINTNYRFSCDTIYVLRKKVYVTKGHTITVDPGTVIKASYTDLANAVDATALIVSRGAKIIAQGSKECPIVFTSVNDPMDGSYNMSNVGQWGGVALLGKGYTNLKKASGGIAIENGIGYIEGFVKENRFNHFGAGAADTDADFKVADDNDNSGVLSYVSIRFSGAVLAAGNELNGLSLGAVGAGTKIDHVEILSNADDGFEMFGGSVNLKYCATMWGDDDHLDYDLGYNGKIQNFFSMAPDSLWGVRSSDNGMELDGDDKKDATLADRHSRAVVSNATIIGNGHIIPRFDNTGGAAIMAKEMTSGEIYNSIFANFRVGLHLATSRGATGGDAYDQWVNLASRKNAGATKAQDSSFRVKNCIFIGTGLKTDALTNGKKYPVTKGSLATGAPATFVAFTAPTPADTAQFFTTDNNKAYTSLAGIDPKFIWNGARNAFQDPYHVVPVANIAPKPIFGFTTYVPYIGAFDASKEDNWLSSWAQSQLISIKGFNSTDVNGDGITNADDSSLIDGNFNAISK